MLPKKLKLGDTIGLVSPASPADPCKMNENINFLKSLGFKIKKSNHLYDKLGYLAGDDKNRGKDLLDMFLDNSVNTILCVRGGYGSSRILPFINYHIIKEHPKIFIGFSDITVLLNTISYRCKFPTFHGPMLTSNLKDTDTLNSLLDTLMCRTKSYTLPNPHNISLKYNMAGTAKGKLVGGNLSLISTTMGTPYEIDFKDNILLIEDVGEPIYSIDRMLTQLHLSGKLKKCSGFILGEFTKCSSNLSSDSRSLQDVIKDKILSLKKPTIYNFMAGHSYPNLTIPIGAKIKLNSCTGLIEVLQPVVRN